MDRQQGALTAAYELGLEDGYWQTHQFEGPHANTEWAMYLRGWLRGHTERMEGPTEEDIAGHVADLIAGLEGGDR